MQRDNPLIAKKYREKKFRKTREVYMSSQHWICERCGQASRICHHKVYITEENYMDDDLFYGEDNLEALCQTCHNKEHSKDKIEIIFDEEGNLIKYEQN